MASSAGSVRVIARPHRRQLRVTAAADTSIYIPAGYFIQNILVEETTNHAITGGLDVGTTDGGQEVIAAMTVGGNSKLSVADTALLKRYLSRTVDTLIYLVAHTAWNSASIDVTFMLSKVYP